MSQPATSDPSRARLSIGFINLAHALDHYVMLIFPTVVIGLQAVYGRSYAELIALGTASFIAFGVFSLPAGWLADRWSRRNMMALFYGGSGLALMAAGLAPNLAALAVALTVVGMFAAIYHPVGTAMLIEQATARGRSLALNGVCGNLGVALAAGITAVLVAALGWRAAFLVPGAVCLAAGALYLRLVPDERRKGYGTALAEYALGFARDKGFKRIRGRLPAQNQTALSFLSGIGALVPMYNPEAVFELPIYDNPLTPGAPTMPEVSGIIGDWPCAALPGEIEAGNIRAFVNFGGSVMRSFPDANRLGPALAALDLHVSFEVVANETTALSTHVLPTKDHVERADIAFWDTLSGSLSMLYSPAMVAPMGERRSAWWAIAQIMRRAGLPVPDHVPEEDGPGTDEAMLASLMAGARCSFAEVAEHRTVTLPLEFPGHWLDAHVERMGGWKLAPPLLVEMWQGLRRADEATLGRPRPLCFISRRQRRKLNASLSFLGSPADIILHPADAEAHGIAHGANVRVHTPRGEIVLTANVSDTIRPGVASIPHGHEVANVNLLTDATVVDAMTGMVRYTGIPIAVAPAG